MFVIMNTLSEKQKKWLEDDCNKIFNLGKLDERVGTDPDLRSRFLKIS